MADELTTTTEVDPAVAVFYDRVLLKRAEPYLIYEIGAQEKDIPAKSGNTVKFRRYAALSVATTPLTEGTTPPGQKLSKTDLTAQVSFYGTFVHIADWVDLTVEDAILTVAASELGIQMGKTLDVLIRDILCACASSANASGGTNGKTPTEMTKSDLDTAIRTLVGNNAEFYMGMIKAGTGQGTVPIRNAYIAKMHTDLLDDLEDISNFVPVSEYAKQEGVMEAEWGATSNIRWLMSSQGHSLANGDFAGTSTLYKVLIHGTNAFGKTTIKKGVAKNIVKAFGSAGTADPLNQRATSGWKTPYVARILNDNFLYVLNVTHS